MKKLSHFSHTPMSTKSLENKLFECKIEDKMGKQKGLQSIIIIFCAQQMNQKLG